MTGVGRAPASTIKKREKKGGDAHATFFTFPAPGTPCRLKGKKVGKKKKKKRAGEGKTKGLPRAHVLRSFFKAVRKGKKKREEEGRMLCDERLFGDGADRKGGGKKKKERKKQKGGGNEGCRSPVAALPNASASSYSTRHTMRERKREKKKKGRGRERGGGTPSRRKTVVDFGSSWVSHVFLPGRKGKRKKKRKKKGEKEKE